MRDIPNASIVARDHSLSNAHCPSMSNVAENCSTHQYECIPEYLLTMTRHHHHHHHQVPAHACCQQRELYHLATTSSAPYATFSRSLLRSRPPPTTTTTATATATTSSSDSSQCTCSPGTLIPITQEDSSVPLLLSSMANESKQTAETSVSSPKSMMIGWTRRNFSSTNKSKSADRQRQEHRYSFLSPLRKSSALQ